MLETLKELGFKFEHSSDKVYEQQYGIPYFVIYKNLNKKTQICYDIAEDDLRLLIMDKSGTILGETEITEKQCIELCRH